MGQKTGVFDGREVTEEQFAKDTLERYSGCEITQFHSNLRLTNFPRYVDYFAQEPRSHSHGEVRCSKSPILPKEDVSILDFKIGSPAAALVVDLCSFLPIKASFSSACAGARRRYQVGEYLVPVASIRGEGTSDFYFPTDVPALANFLMQKAVTEVLEKHRSVYHIGITYTTNMRFWEFNEEFKNRLKATKAQGIEMECATSSPPATKGNSL